MQEPNRRSRQTGERGSASFQPSRKGRWATRLTLHFNFVVAWTAGPFSTHSHGSWSPPSAASVSGDGERGLGRAGMDTGALFGCLEKWLDRCLRSPGPPEKGIDELKGALGVGGLPYREAGNRSTQIVLGQRLGSASALLSIKLNGLNENWLELHT